MSLSRILLAMASCLLVYAGWPTATDAAESPRRTAAAPRIVAYVAGWKMPPDIPAEKLTHINFAFARIDGNGRVFLPQPDIAAKLARLRALKTRNPQLKVLLSVGGWEAEGFSDAALSATSRAAFAASAVALLREHALDGLDLDWEYPGQSTAGIKSRPEDKQNFTLLLAAVRKQLDRASTGGRDSLLTIASAHGRYFDYTEMDKLHVHLNWINVMTYDFVTGSASATGHHTGLYDSPLAAVTDRSADAALKQHLAAGIPADKLVLGAAFYGRAFAGVQPQQQGLNQRYERFEATPAYSELVDKFIGQPGFVREWDAQARAPFLWNATTRAFITYEDPQSLAAKADYVVAQRLGGIMFWELSQDHDDELLDSIVKGLRRPAPAGSPPPMSR